MKILFCALALPAAMFATAASAQVSFVNAAGNFNTPEPSTATVGLADSDGLAGNEYVSLGTPSAGQDTFLRFASAGGQPVTIGSQFSLGTLTYGNFELRKGGRFERVGDATELPLDGEESHLRLERRGGTVIGSVSPDGIRWTPLEPLKVDLPGKVQVGIAAVHNTETPFEPNFEGFRLFR